MFRYLQGEPVYTELELESGGSGQLEVWLDDCLAAEVSVCGEGKATVPLDLTGLERKDTGYEIRSGVPARGKTWRFRACVFWRSIFHDGKKVAKGTETEKEKEERTMGERTETERTKISLRGQDTYDISDHLYGIFLEDIGFSVDGGLNANMVNNYSFDGVYLDRQEIRAVEEPLRYWRFEGERMTSGTEKALSKNSKYARIVVREKASLINYGYSGQQKGWEIPSMSIKEGQTYTFSALVRNRTFNGKIGVQAVNGRGEPAERRRPSVRSRRSWAFPRNRRRCWRQGRRDG